MTSFVNRLKQTIQNWFLNIAFYVHGKVSVPFIALFGSKKEIGELAVSGAGDISIPIGSLPKKTSVYFIDAAIDYLPCDNQNYNVSYKILLNNKQYYLQVFWTTSTPKTIHWECQF